jgi:hypothetical protein
LIIPPETNQTRGDDIFHRPAAFDRNLPVARFAHRGQYPDRDGQLPRAAVIYHHYRACPLGVSAGKPYESGRNRVKNNMNSFLKGMIILLVIVYIVSPLDLCPGPIDDLIVILLGIAARKRVNKLED